MNARKTNYEYKSFVINLLHFKNPIFLDRNWVSMIKTKFWLVMGRSQFFWTRIGLDQPSLVWVLKISPKNLKLFNFFPSGQKKSRKIRSKITPVKDGSASYLLQVKSMLGLGLISSSDRLIKFYYFRKQ